MIGDLRELRGGVEGSFSAVSQGKTRGSEDTHGLHTSTPGQRRVKRGGRYVTAGPVSRHSMGWRGRRDQSISVNRVLLLKMYGINCACVCVCV